uniref:Toll-like receptor 9 n=1 Tax=Gouania willdenowi TaxID=441366 RepID=A0A8C5N9Y3_GOUWI
YKGHLNSLVWLNLIFCAIYMEYFPCDTDKNITKVDCSNRQITHVPHIKSTSVELLDLSWTKIQQVKSDAFANVGNLLTLKIMGNCQPVKPTDDRQCRLKIETNAFKTLKRLQCLYLSRNSLTTIPWLPESLTFLDLQNNCLFNIVDPLPTPNLEVLLLNYNCYYENPCNQSLHISEKFFSKLPKLKTLRLAHNNLTAVPKMLPLSLESLDLRGNTITEILEGAFSNLTVLKKLNLGWNCQRCDHADWPCYPCPGNASLALHNNSFYSQNSSIDYLSLRGNSLRTFPKGIFQPLNKLKTLDLSDNFLAYAIQNGTFFEELTGLDWIRLDYNYEPLMTFPEFDLSPYFRNMTELQTLVLSGNFFQTLSNQGLDVLASFQKLKTLELRMTLMNDFNLTFLKQLSSLSLIDLSENKLKLGSCQSKNQLKKNDLALPHFVRGWENTVPCPISGTNPSNVPVIFDINPLQCDGYTLQTPSVFRYKFCKDKVTFNLSQNNIAVLTKSVLLGMENAVCLDLSKNYINQALEPGPFDNMKKLVYLNMSRNRLDFYNNMVFSDLKDSLKVLDLSYNGFYFQMRGMGEKFNFLQHLNHLEVLSLAQNGIAMRIYPKLISNSLKYLYFNGNDLNNMWKSWKTKYISFFQNLTNLTFLDISDNNLNSLSNDVLLNLPRSITFLNINDNSLNSFPWKTISALSHLCQLNLSHNYLKVLPNSSVPFGANFSLLDISHNSLCYIPELFFSAADSLQYLYLDNNKLKQMDHRHLPAPFKNGSALLKLTLHNNPFECYCDSSDLAEFLRTTSVEIPHLNTRVLCDTPVQGQSILLMDRRSCLDIYGRFAFIISCFLATIFTVIPLLLHLYSWDIWYSLQLLWAGHKGYSKLDGSHSLYHYDAFVVFDTGNQAVRDWVYSELTVNLENINQRRFCLCLEERDWLPGLSCIDNLHNAVHHSRKTVFVLSKGGTDNGVIRQAFFMVQQRLLDEKVDTAVLVLLDEAFPKLKYLNLRRRLCRKSVLSWPRNPRAQPLFWNNMREALSSNNLNLYDNKISESFFLNLYKQ